MDADAYKYIAVNHGNAVMIPIEDAKTGGLLFNLRFGRGDEWEFQTEQQHKQFSQHPEIEIKQVNKVVKVSSREIFSTAKITKGNGKQKRKS